MANESMENLVKEVMGEISEKNKGLDGSKPFSYVVYDPLRARSDGISGTRPSLEHTVRALLSLLNQEPTYVGEILVYKPHTKVFYTKLPNG
jgi:hypothetical protein